MGRVNFQPHDLLEISEGAVRRVSATAPSWVRAALERAPWAVVRRARRPNVVCIGIRGDARMLRCAASIELADVVSHASPEQLAGVRPPRPHPVFDALREMLHVAGSLDLRCGPAGAAGFELATGVPALHAQSDLDAIVWAKPSHPALRTLWTHLQTLRVRCDVEVAFGDGCAVALEEAVSGGALLIKTPDGPRIVHAATR